MNNDTEVTSGSTPAAPQDLEGRSERPRLRLAMVALVIVAAVGFLLVKGLGSSLDYFKTVDQAVAERSKLGTSEFRLEGTVVPGTVERSVRGANFDIASGSATLHVENSGTPPQLFKATMPVIVVGHFAPGESRTFLSDQIMVKHSSNYKASHPDRVKAGNGSVN